MKFIIWLLFVFKKSLNKVNSKVVIFSTGGSSKGGRYFTLYKTLV